MNVQPNLLNLSAYINQNLERDLPLSTLAKRVGLSPFHFHRKFGAYFGETLHQHIKRLRLERAAYALTTGSTPVRQIARDSGYKTVSAFSHAFSGFAGASPTRYRLTSARQDHDGAEADSFGRDVEPAWVGDLAPQPFAFVRAHASGRGEQPSVREALSQIARLIGPLPGADGDGAGDDRYAVIAATSDLYGVSRGGDFRVDVGLDAARVPPDRIGTLGVQMLPGGRYARFDFRSSPKEAIDRFHEAAGQVLRKPAEAPRLTQYFVRFGAHVRTPEAERDYRLFVPIAG